MPKFHKDYSHPDYSLREKLELVVTFFISDCHVVMTIKAHRNGHVRWIFKIRTAYVFTFDFILICFILLSLFFSCTGQLS